MAVAFMAPLLKYLVLLAVLLVLAGSYFSCGEPTLPQGQSEKEAVPKAQDAAVVFPSPQKQPTSRLLQQGAAHLYIVPLTSGEFLELVANQDGVDLQVSVLDPTGTPIFIVDSPNGDTGPERALLVAGQSAAYQFKISGRADGNTGPYRIWIEARRTASEADKKDAKAEALFHQAKQTRKSTSFEFNHLEWKLKEAVRLWSESGKSGREADALRELGALYKSRWMWGQALQVQQSAKSLYQRAGRFADEGALANDLGVTHQILLDLDAAAESFKTALEISQRYDSAPVMAAALHNLGDLARLQGKSAEALEYLQRARALWRGENPQEESKTLTLIGTTFAQAGQLDMAIESFGEALALSKGQAVRRALTLTQIGNAHIQLRQPAKALQYYQDARRIQEAIQRLDHLAVTLNGIGIAYLHQGREQEAVDTLLKSSELFERTHDLRNLCGTLVNLGWAQAALGRDLDAERAYKRALEISLRTRDPVARAAALLGLARLEEKRLNPIEALARAEEAVEAIEGLRVLVGRELRVSFMATMQDVYDALIDILIWRHEIQPAAGFDALALEVSERARSRGLLDDVLPPDARAFRDWRSRVLSVREIQQTVLDPKTLLMEFHLGKRASYLWLVSYNFLKLYKLPPAVELEEMAKVTRELISESRKRENLTLAREHSRKLSRTLLGGAAGDLGNKRLLISVPYRLQAVPFAVLPDPRGEGEARGGVWPKPLVSEHEIVKISSASVLSGLWQRKVGKLKPRQRLAIIADPVFERNDPRLGGRGLPLIVGSGQSPIQLFLGEFKRLIHAREEADSIARTSGEGVFRAYGFAAKTDLVLSGSLRDFGNIHFATHGWLQLDDSDLSALVLSQFNRRGEPINGFLRAGDISGLDLAADLVVLSACETGLGEEIPGEGLVGLPQAFLSAGADRVIVSLWKVDDRATSVLMERLYRSYLSDGLSPAAALREAQLALWQMPGMEAPFNWGAFELQGDWRPVEPPI